MIQLLHEVLGWLGYLQRPVVLIQILLVLAIVSIKALPSNRQYSKVPRLIPPFIGPGLLFSVFIVLGLLNYPNGLVRFFGMTWLGWGFLKMLDLGLKRLIPPHYAQELRNQILIPLFITSVSLLLIQRLDSLQDLSVISIGGELGVEITVGRAFWILVLTYLLVMGSGPPAGLLSWVLQKLGRFNNSSRKATELVLRYGLVSFGILIIGIRAGINTTTMAAIAAGLSVGLGFGIKEIFANFVSGLWLLFEGSIRPGEVLMLDGDPCEVRRLGLRATTLWRDRDNAELLIPNQTFFTEIATTYTRSDRMRRSEIRIRAEFQHHPSKILQILEDTALDSPRVLKYPRPKALQVAYRDFAVEYSLRYWIDNPMNNIGIISEVNQAIWEAFQKQNIDIPYPKTQFQSISQLPQAGLPSQAD